MFIDGAKAIVGVVSRMLKWMEDAISDIASWTLRAWNDLEALAPALQDWSDGAAEEVKGMFPASSE